METDERRTTLHEGRSEDGDFRRVYLVQGFVLFLSFPEQDKRNKPKNQMNQIPTTQREMVPGIVFFFGSRPATKRAGCRARKTPGWRV